MFWVVEQQWPENHTKIVLKMKPAGGVSSKMKPYLKQKTAVPIG